MEKIEFWQEGEYTYPLAFDFRPNLRAYLLDDGDVPLVHRSGDEENVRMLGIAGVDDAETLDVEPGAKCCEDFDIAAVAA